MLYLSRTSIETWQRCPRKYYLSQQALGTGIYRTPRPLAIERGIAYHAGIAAILLGSDVDEAIKTAQATLAAEAVPRTSLIDLETKWWLELVLRTFAHYIESFLASYDVLTVEHEVTQKWGKHVTWMSKGDAYLRDKYSNGLVVLSNKTTTEISWYQQRDYAHDLQGYLELKYLDLFARQKGWTAPIEYQQTVYAIKGSTMLVRIDAEGYFNELKNDEYQDGDVRVSSLPILYPWVRLNTPEAIQRFPDTSLAWRYKFRKPGNKSENTLSTHFKRRPIWEFCETPKDWFELLENDLVFPPAQLADGKSPLDSLIVFDNPCYRNQRLMNHLLEQIQHQSQHLVRALFAVAQAESLDQFISLLDQHFPQYVHNCFAFQTQCEFYDFCVGTQSDGQLEHALYEIKQPPEEFEQRKPHYEAELTKV